MLSVNTYEAVKKLQSAKFTKSQAEAVVNIIAEVEGEAFTKKDAELMESRIDARFSEMEARINGQFAAIDGHFSEVEGRFAKMEAKFDTKLARLEARMVWKIFAGNGLLLGVAFGLLRLSGAL